jgi:hypothetical protein
MERPTVVRFDCELFPDPQWRLDDPPAAEVEKVAHWQPIMQQHNTAQPSFVSFVLHESSEVQ